MNKTCDKKGFTLIEILVSTAMFAVLMVMTTSIIIQSVGYQSKLRAIRAASQESRRIADMLTRDIHSANRKIDYSANIN